MHLYVVCFQIEPGINNSVFQAIRAKAQSMDLQAKVCSLAVDEMALKEQIWYDPKKDRLAGFQDFGEIFSRTYAVANHAVTFMVRGIGGEPWKLPLGYVLSRGPLCGEKTGQLVKHFVHHVESAGLLVKSVVCDQGSNNQAMLKHELKVHPDKPYFIFNGHKIFTFNDAPHLLKSVRNNLKKTGFKIHNHKVSWKFIVEYYKFVKKSPGVRANTKLTDKHLELPPFSPMNVRLAAQVLSHSVASGISWMVQGGNLPQLAEHTAEFVERIDRLFNCFNSRHEWDSAPMRGAILTESGHMAFLEECSSWLSTVTAQSGRRLPCLDGWKHNINSLIGLWNDLKCEHGFTQLLTSRLNQDCLENLFSVIRGKGGQRTNPDSQQFRTAFRQVLVDAIMTSSGTSNCQPDYDTFLLATLVEAPKQTKPDQSHSHLTLAPVLAGVQTHKVNSTLWVTTVAGTNTKLAAQYTSVLAYIGGYLCRKVAPKACTPCQTKITGDLDKNNQDHSLIRAKQYEGTKLYVPSRQFQRVVENLEKVFMECIEKAVHREGGTRDYISNMIKQTNAFRNLECSSCPVATITTNLFIMMRLHFYIKLKNRSLKTCAKGKQNRKMLHLTHT